MNIFAIDQDPSKAARQLHDRHVVKMILESAQMLSTCRQAYGDNRDGLLKACFHNHPCNVWLRESHSNYDWLVRHMIGLLREYTYRYNKLHRYENLVVTHFAMKLKGLSDKDLTPFTTAMPGEYKTTDPIQSYRNYYLSKKIQGNFWTNRYPNEMDDWLSTSIQPSQFKKGHE